MVELRLQAVLPCEIQKIQKIKSAKGAKYNAQVLKVLCPESYRDLSEKFESLEHHVILWQIEVSYQHHCEQRYKVYGYPIAQ